MNFDVLRPMPTLMIDIPKQIDDTLGAFIKLQPRRPACTMKRARPPRTYRGRRRCPRHLWLKAELIVKKKARRGKKLTRWEINFLSGREMMKLMRDYCAKCKVWRRRF